MPTGYRKPRQAAVIVLLTAALALVGVRAAGQEVGRKAAAAAPPSIEEGRPAPPPATEATTPPRPAPDAARAISLTSDLIGGLEPASAGAGERTDVTGLASRLLDLSPEQRGHIGRLAAEHGEERAALLTKLNEEYAEKVRAVLTEQQRVVYDGALSALKAFADETAGARKEFVEAVQAAMPGAPVPPDLRIATADPAALVGLGEDKRRGLQSLRESLNKSLHDALQQRLDHEAMKDPAAWQEHRKQFREAQQKAQSDFEVQRAALLSPEERMRLDKVEEAVSRYNDRVRQARHDAAARLLELLQAPAAE
jgi:hypothetical protein